MCLEMTIRLRRGAKSETACYVWMAARVNGAMQLFRWMLALTGSIRWPGPGVVVANQAEFLKTMTVLLSARSTDDIVADPFCERPRQLFSTCKWVLGGCFVFESSSRPLLDLVEAAYGGLPAHQLANAWPEFRVTLRLVSRHLPSYVSDPPPVSMQSGGGMLCGVMDASNYVVLMPDERRALIVASEDMLGYPYHLRYELIEFTVFTLAARSLGLIPLHAACVGRRGKGVLLLGASGSGKSTLALHSLLRGLDFLAEDAVFVHPESLHATGVANYLHVKPDALRFVEDDETCRWLEGAPLIQRRSGVEKLEADLRESGGHLASAPLKLVGAVFVSSTLADHADGLLQAMPAEQAMQRLADDQPYALGQSGWNAFADRLVHSGVHELRRGRHPTASIDALLKLLK